MKKCIVLILWAVFGLQAQSGPGAYTPPQAQKAPQVKALSTDQKNAVLKKAFRVKSLEAEISAVREKYLQEMNERIQQLRNAYQAAAGEYKAALAPIEDMLKTHDLDEDLNLIPKSGK